jgi:DNA-binding transcriptional LysR family regulator
MDLDDLQLFVRIAHAGSLSGAARQLPMKLATVSARLQRIEAELEVRLFERSTRSLRLTAEGERFLQTCETLQAQWSEGLAQLRDGSLALAGRIRLAAPADTSQQWLGRWLAEFALQHPQLRITMLVGDQLHPIQRDAVDIAIRYGALEDSSLIGRLLGHTERRLVAAPDYLRRAGKPETPADLAQHRCLAWLRREQPQQHWLLRHSDGRSHTVRVDAALCGDGLLVRQWALQGFGIAYKASLEVADDLAAGRLVPVLPDWRGEAEPITAILPGGVHRPRRVEALLAHLQERFLALT